MTEPATPSTTAPSKPKRGRKASGLPRGAREGQRNGKPGNPDWDAFVPTDEQRNLVKAMVGYGIPQHDIAALTINPQTGKPISDMTLRKHFEREIREGKPAANARVVGALFKNATTATAIAPGGHVTAQIFWLKNRDRENWGVGEGRPGDLPPTTPIATEPTLREDARRIAFLLDRQRRLQKKLPA